MSTTHLSTFLFLTRERSSPLSLITSLNALKLSSHLRGTVTVLTSAVVGSTSTPYPCRNVATSCAPVICCESAPPCAAASTASPLLRTTPTVMAAPASTTPQTATTASFRSPPLRKVHTNIARFPPYDFRGGVPPQPLPRGTRSGPAELVSTEIL